MRSARNLELYKNVFGEDFGLRDELILDVGAGDATVADEIEALSDHKAKVIRLDRDYSNIPPEGEAPAVAGEATQMPFEDNSFDSVVSHNMMYYLGREKGADTMREMLRVVKAEGNIALYPAKPLTGVDSEIGAKQHVNWRSVPRLVITKPADFDTWDEARKESAYVELTKALTVGAIGTKLIHFQMARTIQQAGTHRTAEHGKPFSF